MSWRIVYQSNTVAIGCAVCATLLLNLVFFSLLPYLTQVEDDIVARSLAPAVSVVRMAPVTPPPPPPPQASQKPPEPAQSTQQVVQNRPAPPTPKLTLDLMLQPEFSRVPAKVSLPEVQLTQLKALPAIFDSSALDQPLTPLAQSPFIYPMRAKRLGIEGWVKIKLLISKEGNVEQIKFLEAQPKDVFESTVERGVKLWRFSTGTVNGKPVRSWVVTTIHFELES